MTHHTDIFAALAREFQPGEVKSRPQGGQQIRYITARVVMNRLDEVLGPANWWDDYEPHENSVICRLTIRLPDGSTLTKTDAGGYAGMTDQGDDDKSGFSDAFKRAAVKFGVGRYLYRDGVAKLPADPKPEPQPKYIPRTNPPDAKDIETWARGFVSSVNGAWTKEIGEPCPAELPSQLIHTFRLSGHLLKAAMQHGMIEPAINVPTGERWKHLAPAWEQHSDAIVAEARAYCRQLWKDAKAKLQPAAKAEPKYDEVDDGNPVDDGKAWKEGRE